MKDARDEIKTAGRRDRNNHGSLDKYVDGGISCFISKFLDVAQV